MHAVSSGGGFVAVLETSRSSTVPRGPEFLGDSAPAHGSLPPALLHMHEVGCSSPLAPTTRNLLPAQQPVHGLRLHGVARRFRRRHDDTRADFWIELAAARKNRRGLRQLVELVMDVAH